MPSVASGAAALHTYLKLREAGHSEQTAPRGSGMVEHSVDLVIAQPVSWLPLVADYTRFARTRSGAAVGTYAGYAVGNLWFYALLTATANQD